MRQGGWHGGSAFSTSQQEGAALFFLCEKLPSTVKDHVGNGNFKKVLLKISYQVGTFENAYFFSVEQQLFKNSCHVIINSCCKHKANNNFTPNFLWDLLFLNLVLFVYYIPFKF